MLTDCSKTCLIQFTNTERQTCRVYWAANTDQLNKNGNKFGSGWVAGWLGCWIAITFTAPTANNVVLKFPHWFEIFPFKNGFLFWYNTLQVVCHKTSTEMRLFGLKPVFSVNLAWKKELNLMLKVSETSSQVAVGLSYEALISFYQDFICNLGKCKTMKWQYLTGWRYNRYQNRLISTTR